MVIKMNSDTFDKISNKELGGFRAVVSGKLTFKGNLNTIKKFDGIVYKYTDPKLESW